MSGSQLTPEERAKRLEAMLDDIRDEPESTPPNAPDAPGGAVASPELSSPDLESLDAGWGEDEEDAAEESPEAPAVSAPPPSGMRTETHAAKPAPEAPPAAPSAPPTPIVPVSAAPPAHHFDDEDEDERTVIGTVPDLVARTRHQMMEPSIETQRPTPVKNVIVEPAAQHSQHMQAARDVTAPVPAPAKAIAAPPPQAAPKTELPKVAPAKTEAPNAAPPKAVAKAPEPTAPPVKPLEKPISVVDKRAAEEPALARKDQRRAKAEELRERKRAKAEAAAAKQKQKQPKVRRSTSEPLVKIARPSVPAPDDSGDIPATETPEDSTLTVRTKVNKNRDLARMAMIVAIVVLLGGTALVMLRR